MTLRPLLLALIFTAPLAAQELSAPTLSQDEPMKPRQFVLYTAEPQTIPAGKRTTLTLHFHVRDGFHVNSHLPKSELQLPTVLELAPTPGVRPLPAVYPPGHPYSIGPDPADQLDVYTGDFTLQLPVTARPGDHSLSATLHYQACDHAACYPPKTLSIQLPFTAR